mmetsp:Transcript_13055/g.21139  ORF Transcript_13055/g.21139 Transcript_13055/m.21139 type:complete len:186 (-) Transcript_13055:998-1555(-)|eukprot:CAMPEP_0203797208 /NCGR_PEP_ID=MMETSP0100_2-20121128/8483_1 /ASSEMBLY_ACC=CAM_ASM_000210 /TAXON_ID=96639 /ORGANISM=" , Strain NY0313808BC1" /LENGTH=185 /DNA_ID=CAMNT_0050702453 /DNA_START=22 /DNA_END=579 /DNA_ORIENTATION=-
MLIIFATRQAVKLVKSTGYKKLTVDMLNADGGEDCEFLGIADVEAEHQVKMGVTGRPSFLVGIKNFISEKMGKHRKIFMVVKSKDGKVMFLFFKPDSIENFDDPEMLSGKGMDTGFSTGKGLSALSLDNCEIHKKDHNTFEFYPVDQKRIKTDYFVVKIIEDSTQNEHSAQNGAKTAEYLNRVAT